jgi:tight adherence protein C
MDREQFFLLCVFGVVAALAYGFSLVFLRDKSQQLARRLMEDRELDVSGSSEAVPLLSRMGEAIAKPFEPRDRQKQSALRRRLAQAGLYSMTAMRLFIAGRMVCLATGALGGYWVGVIWDQPILALSAGGLLGYVLPMMWLRWRLRRHQDELERGLPDALDLMVVCVEAGLTTDAAMQRVGREIALPHPALARELSIVHAETQVGVPRAQAMRNMAQRTSSPTLQSLAALLIQTDRFGTSVASTLRVHADSLRHKQQCAAEEAAAKTSVKLIFPVAMMIFPTVLLVLIGPAIIQMVMSGFLKR